VLHGGGDFRIQGICPRHGPVSRLGDDVGSLSQHRGSRTVGALNRPGAGCPGLVWHVHGAAGLCDCGNPGGADSAQSCPGTIAEAYAYLLYILLAVELNDVAAFTFGKLFGRRPLRSNISPHKTWEGSLGALAVSLALPWALWFTFPHLQSRELILAGL